MLDGVNDQPEHAEALIKIARQVPCKLNLIPFNPFPNSEFKKSPRERIVAFQRRLSDAGIVTTIRKTRGDDIDAACGQLAGQIKDRTRRTAGRTIAIQVAKMTNTVKKSRLKYISVLISFRMVGPNSEVSRIPMPT